MGVMVRLGVRLLRMRRNVELMGSASAARGGDISTGNGNTTYPSLLVTVVNVGTSGWIRVGHESLDLGVADVQAAGRLGIVLDFVDDKLQRLFGVSYTWTTD